MAAFTTHMRNQFFDVAVDNMPAGRVALDTVGQLLSRKDAAEMFGIFNWFADVSVADRQVESAFLFVVSGSMLKTNGSAVTVRQQSQKGNSMSAGSEGIEQRKLFVFKLWRQRNRKTIGIHMISKCSLPFRIGELHTIKPVREF